MTNNVIRNFAYFTVFVLLQVLVLNNIYFLRVATPFIYLYCIIKLPVGTSQVNVIIFSFLAGLVVDAFTNTPGMHAAACTLVGFSREILVRFFMGKDLPDGIPSYKTFHYGGYFGYVLSFVLIHHIALFMIESLTFFDALFLAFRIFASVIMTTLLICTVEAFNLESQSSGEQ